MDSSLTPEELFRLLLSLYGPRNWWPVDREYHTRNRTDPREEIVIGAILTQNTSWRNVEKALERLKTANALSFRAIRELSTERLEELIRPAGYFRQKARYLKEVAERLDPVEVVESIEREELLTVKGVGRETADVILLYAGGRPFFVIDAYTKRIVRRVFGVDGHYEALRRWFEERLPRDVEIYREFHALLDEHAKRFCRKEPLCEGCGVRDVCVLTRAAKH